MSCRYVRRAESSTEHTRVRRLRGLLVQRVDVVLLTTDAQVRRLVEPDGERIPVGDEEPLANVELTVVDQQRSLCGETRRAGDAAAEQ